MDRRLKTHPNQWGAFLGYLQKTKDKWQKAVADWKSKTRSKAADIKIQLNKTGGGGQGRQLSENEKRLIGIIGWTSIRGDKTVELGSIQAVTGSEESCSSNMEHNYSFQTEPAPIRNVVLSPPPLFPLLERKSITDDDVEMIKEVPSILKKNKGPLKGSKTLKKGKNQIQRAPSANLEKMHTETLNILTEINTNIKKMTDSQDRMCDIQEDLLGYLKGKI